MNDNLKLVNTPEGKFYCLDPKTSNLLENLRDLASAYPGIDDKMIHPGDVCFDIGANIGTFSTLAARLSSPEGRVFAFEPCSETHEILLENLRLNNVSHLVQVQTDVISDTQKNFSIKKAPKNMGATRFIESSEVEGELFTSTTLDFWIENNLHLKQCNFIKIDVEGMEIKVLQGARKTLKQYHPILYIEVCSPHYEKYGFKIEQLQEFLAELGYHFFRYFAPAPFLTSDLRRLHSLNQGSYFYNLIAIHPSSSRYPQKYNSTQEAFLFMIEEKSTITYSELRRKFPIRTTIKKLVRGEKKPE
ncbi:MAG: FkbM family methyltransferase [Microcystis sp. M53599_WE4]|nr:FkbM family methyltransferase [Microcystis sp. M53599_WE4]